jgi:hypothetical protein
MRHPPKPRQTTAPATRTQPAVQDPGPAVQDPAPAVQDPEPAEPAVGESDAGAAAETEVKP